MCIIQFGRGSESLALQIHGRVKPDATDYWQANWLHCTAEARTGIFCGKLDWQLRNEDLARFLYALPSLQRGEGDALLDTGDGWLDIQMMRDEQGRIEAHCQLAENPVSENALEFRVLLHEDELPLLIGQVHEALRSFPIIGQQEGDSGDPKG